MMKINRKGQIHEDFPGSDVNRNIKTIKQTRIKKQIKKKRKTRMREKGTES